MPMTFLPRFITTALFAGGLAPAFGQLQLLQIGDPGTASSQAIVEGVSADGTVVVGWLSSASVRGMRWDLSGQIDVYPIAHPNGMTAWPSFFDCTGDGQAMFGSSFAVLPDFPFFSLIPASTAPGGSTTPYIPPMGFTQAEITACSDSGDMAFGGKGMPLMWDASGLPTVLTHLADGTPSLGHRFTRCSGDGSVAVTTDLSQRSNYVWTAASGLIPASASAAPGANALRALAVNADGSRILGTLDLPGGLFYGTLAVWSPGGTPTIFGTLPNTSALLTTENTGVYNDLSASGDLAVFSHPGASSATNNSGFWRPETGPVDLVSYAAEFGADLTGWDRVLAKRVSGNERLIAGDGIPPGGGGHAGWAIRLPEGWWNVAGSSYCSPGELNSTGDSARTVAYGSNIAAANSLRLETHGLPQDSFGFYLASQSQGFAPMPGGSQGNLCLSGSIGRYVGPGQIRNSGTYERTTLPIDLSELPTPTGPLAAQPGDTWNFQLWYRDVVGGQVTSNFSDAVAVLIQ